MFGFDILIFTKLIIFNYIVNYIILFEKINKWWTNHSIISSIRKDVVRKRIRVQFMKPCDLLLASVTCDVNLLNSRTQVFKFCVQEVVLTNVY